MGVASQAGEGCHDGRSNETTLRLVKLYGLVHRVRRVKVCNLVHGQEVISGGSAIRTPCIRWTATDRHGEGHVHGNVVDVPLKLYKSIKQD